MLHRFRKLFVKDSRHNLNGEEILDPTPIALPVKFKKPLSLQEQIARFVRNEDIQKALARQGVETFEEAEDFDVDDDSDEFTRTSPWEEEFEGQFEEHRALESREFEQAGTERRRKAPPPSQPSSRSFQEEKPIKRTKKVKKEELDDDDQE